MLSILFLKSENMVNIVQFKILNLRLQVQDLLFRVLVWVHLQISKVFDYIYSNFESKIKCETMRIFHILKCG
jgi:hypothetical protein